MSLDDWSVHQLRATLFSSEPFPVSEAGWKLLTGQEEAENRVDVAGGRQYSGRLLGGRVALTFTASRIDVILAFDATIPTVDVVPVFGKWTDLSGSFLDLMQPFLGALNSPITRMAFGANLMAPVPSRRRAYEELAGLLKSVNVDVENMRELIFRINWPQPSKELPGLEINRLTGWASLVFSSNVFHSAGSEVMVSAAQKPPSDVVNLDIDHNTSSDRKDRFESRHLVPIFRELVTLANENVRDGERP